MQLQIKFLIILVILRHNTMIKFHLQVYNIEIEVQRINQFRMTIPKLEHKYHHEKVQTGT